MQSVSIITVLFSSGSCVNKALAYFLYTAAAAGFPMVPQMDAIVVSAASMFVRSKRCQSHGVIEEADGSHHCQQMIQPRTVSSIRRLQQN